MGGWGDLIVADETVGEPLETGFLGVEQLDEVVEIVATQDGIVWAMAMVKRCEWNAFDLPSNICLIFYIIKEQKILIS